jgi:hypothetical protein
LKRWQAGLPEAAASALDPAYWRPRLEFVALKTLRAQWALERDVQTRALYERLTPRLLATLTAELSAGVARFSLQLPESALAAGFSIQTAVDYKLNQLTPAGRERKFALHEPDQEAHVEAVRQAIRDWVTLEKRRDERDEGLTDEQIADRIEEILGLSDRAVPRERTPAMEEAAAGLMKSIESWLAGDGDTPAVNRGTKAEGRGAIAPEVAAQWFEAVLLAWRSYLQTHLRDRLEAALEKLHRRVQTELI